jgi:hypothetical protein
MARRRGPLIALIDGPLAPDHPALARQMPADEAPPDSPGGRHAAAVAQAILAGAPEARFLSLPVFGQRLVTDAGSLAAALRAAAEAEIVHCSLGLPRPDELVGAAVAALTDGGRALVAAAPARGRPVWPAAYPGVASAQGDARCGPGDWSFLDLPGALFGACPRLEGHPGIAGASIAAAHLTGLIAGLVGRGASPRSAIAELRSRARFVGRERRA